MPYIVPRLKSRCEYRKRWHQDIIEECFAMRHILRSAKNAVFAQKENEPPDTDSSPNSRKTFLPLLGQRIV